MRLTAEADRSYPIILAADGRVMDGMHRIARAVLDGETTIKAVRFTTDPEPDHRNCTPEDLPL
jgi:elongation factor P hydroxylase